VGPGGCRAAYALCTRTHAEAKRERDCNRTWAPPNQQEAIQTEMNV